MLKKILTTGVLFILAISFAWATGESTPWMDDFDAALKEAKDSNRKLIVDFSGSDWCKWCIKLDEEVFAKPEFYEPASKNYVMVVLDFPRGEELKAKIKNPERNDELVKKFKIRGYPTVLLLDGNGDAYAKTGYRDGGPEPYLKHLAALEEASSNINSVITNVASKTGDAKLKELIGLFDFMDSFTEKGLDFSENLAIGAPKLDALMKEGLSLDKDNEHGLKLKAAQYLLARGGAPEALQAIMEIDPKNEMGEYEKALQIEITNKMNSEDAAGAVELIKGFVKDKSFKDKEVEAFVHYMGGHACRMLDDKEQAKAYFEKAKETTSNSRMAAYIDKLLKDL